MDTDYRRAANITIIAAGAALFFWLIIKYALGALTPFLISAAVAAIISPLAEKISRKTRISRKAIAIILVLLVFFAVGYLIYLGISRLADELQELLQRLESDPDGIGRMVDKISEKLNGFGERFGFLRAFSSSDGQETGIDLYATLINGLKDAVASLASALSSAAVGIVTKIPSFLLFMAALLLSAFYFAIDRDKIGGALTSILPDKWQKKLPFVKERIKSSLTGYLKAYLLIMLLTFIEMLIGLTVLKVNYAFIMAIIIAIVDVLPVLGTGAVLIPWAIFSFATSDARLGTGLLILYGASLIIRQIAEPKIVGNSIGLHPLATLASIYLGIRFLGFAGIFIGPVIALLIKGFLGGEAVKDKEKKQS